MGPGANFVMEMQRGLRGTSRFIALHSAGYETSDHCQAEWSAAYNEDSGAAKRKILPFLVQPCELQPLARQLVYTSLIGLDAAARRTSILAAVTYEPQAWTRTSAATALAHKASPDIALNDAKQIDAAANAQTDTPYLDMDLPDFVDIQINIVETLRLSFPQQAPPATKNAVTSYGQHLGQKRQNFITGLLVQLATPVETTSNRADFKEFDLEFQDLVRSFLANHTRLLTYHTRRSERERLFSEIPINEEAAEGSALADPIRKVNAAVPAAAEAGQVTQGFVDTHAVLNETAATLASEALVPNAPQLPSTIVTPKRRAVLTTIGFYERLVAFLGSTASIATTPTGQSLMKAANEALEALWKLVPFK